MFATVELGQSLSPQDYEAKLPALRARLLQAHLDLRGRKFPVVVVVSGADGAGKGELVHRLNEWLDPRGVATHAFWALSDEERERPRFWRFWRALPGRGRVGILFGSWYTAPVIARVHRQIKRSAFDTELDRIARFEQMLAADGAVFVKLWLHLPRKVQKKRLKKLEAQGRIAPDDWKHFKLYDRFTEISERAVRRTDTGAAPWHVIEATDRRYREFTAGAILLEALESALARPAAGAAAPSPPPEAGAVAVAEPAAAPAAAPAAEGAVAAPPAEARRSILDHVDLSPHLAEAEYEEQLEKQQKALGQLAWKAHAKGRSVVLVFEGWDAAGKGSAIRRVTQAIDPRLHRVVGIAAPTDEERAQHYLWRFWRHLPRAGFMTIFDRSWYGRVLVERVEGFARPDEWNRAYHEINEFEEELVEHGVVVNKFWLHISPAEQLRRFNERETVAYKRYKITDEDWRNRKKWDDYKAAVDEMVARCGTEYAPWTIVPANDKRFARIQILKTINQQLRAAL